MADVILHNLSMDENEWFYYWMRRKWKRDQENDIIVAKQEGSIVKLITLIYKKKLKNKTREQIIDDLGLEEADIEILDNYEKYTYLLNGQTELSNSKHPADSDPA